MPKDELARWIALEELEADQQHLQAATQRNKTMGKKQAW